MDCCSGRKAERGSDAASTPPAYALVPLVEDAAADEKTVAALKGQSNVILDLHFFHFSNLPNGLKYFDFGISLIYSNFRFKKTDWPGYDTRGD